MRKYLPDELVEKLFFIEKKGIQSTEVLKVMESGGSQVKN